MISDDTFILVTSCISSSRLEPCRYSHLVIRITLGQHTDLDNSVITPTNGLATVIHKLCIYTPGLRCISEYTENIPLFSTIH